MDWHAQNTSKLLKPVTHQGHFQAKSPNCVDYVVWLQWVEQRKILPLMT